jgi:probable HAF family extracellular repeat protein
MSFNSWLQNLRSALAPSRGQRHHRRRNSLRARAHRLNLEALEDRCVPAVYAVTDLGTIGGYYSTASDLNQAGQVVGQAGTADGLGQAFLWENGTMIDLGTLGGNSGASGINDLGQVVGSFLAGDTSYHAFLVTPQGGMWFQDDDLDGRNDFMIDLGTLNGSDSSWAADINNAGQVVGASADQTFLWDAANGMIDLGTPMGFTSNQPSGINELGQVTGVAWYYDDLSAWHSSAFLWDAANGMTVLGADSWATDLNDAGQVVGDAFLWTPDSPNGLTGSFTDLGMLPSLPDINNVGQIVGHSMVAETVLLYDEWGEPYYETYYYPHAFVWDAASGMVDLQSQLLPGSDATLQYVASINDGGVIAVTGQSGSGERSYLLTPIPPGTPLISIANAPAVTEGNAGTRAATFSVNLSEPSDQFVTVDFTTAAGSAAAGSDYQSTSGTLTFAPGEMSKTITVQVIGDRLAEPNETFVVNLSAPTNATIGDGQGIGTILDDEPRVSINDVTVTEGNTGAVNATFTVSLSVAYDLPVTVHYQTSNGSATAGSDYAAASGDVTIAAGQTTKTFTVAVIGDRSAEPTENFVVNLSAATNGLIVDSQGVGTILDNEPRISISDVTKSEGRKGQTTLFTFTVTLSAAYDQAVTMSYRTVNGTARTGDNDYVARAGTLTFNPGQTTKTITIEVKGDSKRECSETFYLDLFGNGGNSLFTKNRGLGTILNDD